MNLQECLEQLNAQLKAAKYPVQIYSKSGRLSLQATLPPPPGSQKSKPYQQRISLGLPLSVEGLTMAEYRAKELGAALLSCAFDWESWGRAPIKTCLQWVEQFERDYFQRRARTPKSETTWKHDYQKIFKKLPLNAPLTEAVLMEVILSTSPDSRTRQRACRVLTALAKFADVELDTSPYKGSYGLRQLRPRDLPTDKEIVHWRNQIRDPQWRWVYGCLAAYGLRPHEICHISLIDPPRADIADGKTGARLVFPFHPEWFDEWDLAAVQLPKLSGKNNSALGNRVTHAFKRLHIPFPPMALRHCWAVRTIDYLEPSLAAQEMGHSLEVHNRVYHHWISARQHREAFERAKRKMR